ncbi:flagellar biosynthesis repressor FlbT [Niveispirillum cyanobacteriorum]|uniref:Flagellar protein n=1 Tax=Niveispirillum cyanobacteriorum TaxID=1612173 RepID=A0A2K9NG24_9PROT|nr:flagellar biosynthesis repressor FlbT [Niveispirillum cyanobacteriorum]AUN32049.1 flagellar protein [Niveispirillum cyanobacteriorum]GGE73733.1 flagellar FlbT [Niveispirillum cyanobacteriorum]
MPLKLVLRPGEKLIVNGAVLGVGDHPVSLFFYNKVNFLRGREILKEENCDTIEKKLYFIIQLIYIFPEDAELNLIKFGIILEEARLAHSAESGLFDEVQTLVQSGNYYRALKICRKLFPAETASGAGDAADKQTKTPVVVTKVRRRPSINQPE